MSNLYDLTLKKEVSREGAWEIMGRISRVEKKIGESQLLKLIEKKIGEEIRNIPGMSEEEVNEFKVKIHFLIDILSELEEMQ